MTTEPTLVEFASQLYAGPQEDFIATRNARAKETPDPTLSAQIRALRKPSVAAWVVNVFAQERVSQLAEALHLAEELREAQADLDARALAQLGRDRRALTNRLASSAVELAEARGERITASTHEAVRQTITAAFFDPIAAVAVASGRLVRALEPAGSFADDADALVGGGAADAPEIATRPVDEVSARRERRDAERTLREAEQAHVRAERDAARADRALRDASVHVEELAERERELETELESVRRDATNAQVDLTEAEGRQRELAERVSGTEQAVDDAHRILDGLSSS